MKVGTTHANTPVSDALAASGRLDAGGSTQVERKVVERLRQTDAELRAKIRKEASATLGAPRFIDTRGPDLGLYTVDGMVLGGVTSRAYRMAEEFRAKSPQTKETQTEKTEVAGYAAEAGNGVVEPPVSEAGPAVATVKPAPPVAAATPRGVAAYAPRAGASPSALGSAKDFKV